MAERLVRVVREMLSPAGGELLLDVGAGIGLLGLSLADAVGGIIAVEENPWAVADLLANAGEREQVGVVEAPLAEGLGEIEGVADLAIVTPPQTGLGAAGVGELSRLAPARIVYVSHDVATMARDATLLGDAGYTLAEVQPMDLLPQTYRVAAVGLWEVADAGDH